MLLTGETPRYLRTELEEGAGEESMVAEHALWWPPSKIAGRHLAPYLATLATADPAPPAPPARNPVSIEVELDPPETR